MAQVANNADDYALPRQNIFFPGVVPSLDGQCVSLEKWFLAEMTSVPNPQAPRGDAKLVGRTLVNQGHAVEVPFSDRRRGDIVCQEYGTYGHVYIQLSGGNVFESNVNMGGVSSKIIDGERVYASRIGSEKEAWRIGKNPHVYRIKSYNEIGDNMPTDKQIDETINAACMAVFGSIIDQAIYDIYRPVLKLNYVSGVLLMLDNWYKDPRAGWRSKSNKAEAQDIIKKALTLSFGNDDNPVALEVYTQPIVDNTKAGVQVMLNNWQDDPNALYKKPNDTSEFEQITEPVFKKVK
jgi:hypothetical protein